MRTKIFNVLKLSGLAVVLSFGVSYVLAWSTPSVTAPGNNAAVPLNVSATSQTKAGGITVGGLTSSSGIDVSNAGGAYTYISLHDDESPSGVKYIHANSNVVGFLNSSGSWSAYWDNFGNQQNMGTVYAYNGVNAWGSAVNNGAVVGRNSGASGIGVYGVGDATTGAGVFGKGQEGVIGIGTKYGVWGDGATADFIATNKGVMYPDSTIQSTAASYKQCKGSNGAYIQNFVVPTSWTRAQCLTMLQNIGAASAWWSVGCLSKSGPTTGDWGLGWTPPVNNSCGWDGAAPTGGGGGGGIGPRPIPM